MNFSNPITKKKYLAFAGVTWFFYLVFHVLSLQNFHFGKTHFNDFYLWYKSSFLHIIILLFLIISLFFHVFVAISRQLENNKSAGISYQKSHPNIIPRWIAWSGAAGLLGFIVFHFVQIKILEQADMFLLIENMFSQPLMWLIYGFGLLTLSTHLYHALVNVLQSLGISHKQNKLLAIIIVGILTIGFISIPIRSLYA